MDTFLILGFLVYISARSSEGKLYYNLKEIIDKQCGESESTLKEQTLQQSTDDFVQQPTMQTTTQPLQPNQPSTNGGFKATTSMKDRVTLEERQNVPHMASTPLGGNRNTNQFPDPVGFNNLPKKPTTLTPKLPTSRNTQSNGMTGGGLDSPNDPFSQYMSEFVDVDSLLQDK